MEAGNHSHLHNKYIFIFTNLHSPGQLSVLQSSASCRPPGHSAPPCCGKGLSQNRCLFLLPPSQPLSQTVHEDHSPQAPSRATSAKMGNFIKLLQFKSYQWNKLNTENHEIYVDACSSFVVENQVFQLEMLNWYQPTGSIYFEVSQIRNEVLFTFHLIPIRMQ